MSSNVNSRPILQPCALALCLAGQTTQQKKNYKNVYVYHQKSYLEN